MKDDPEYRAQVLSLLQRGLGASFAPRNCSILITVGTCLNQYRADSWPVGNDSEFHLRSKDILGEQRMERHKKYMELAEEAAAKSQLAAMLNNGNLREIFGSEIAGIPTETVLAIMQAQVWSGGAIF